MNANRSKLQILSVLICCSVCVVGNSQTRRASNLKRDEAVINRNRPTIYLCLERKTDRDISLRIYNNTIWMTRFPGQGKTSRLLELPDGTRVAAVSNGDVVSPQYRFESKQTGVERDYRWGDLHSVVFLPSDTYAVFKVPVESLKDDLLFLEYQYEWEFTGAVASESYPPRHRVYFSGNSCNW